MNKLHLIRTRSGLLKNKDLNDLFDAKCEDTNYCF